MKQLSDLVAWGQRAAVFELLSLTTPSQHALDKAVIVAAWNNNKDIIDLLVRYGANANACDHRGRSVQSILKYYTDQ